MPIGFFIFVGDGTGLERRGELINHNALRQWVEAARELCRESGHLAVCDIQIGEVLAHAPNDGDGSWPCVAVRDLVEDTDSAELSRGFVIGILNRRGVTMRLPTDGGTLERADAERYMNYAKTCEIEWPKTAAALRNVAASYEERSKARRGCG